MATLISNMPAEEVWVRKEYLTDFQSGHGEFTPGVWVSCKSMPGRAFYFETYLPEYAAVYDKLPISAFVSEPKTPDPDMDLPNLQFWNCMDYGVTTICKQFIGSMAVSYTHLRAHETPTNLGWRRRQRQMCIRDSLTYSSGTVWTMVSQLYANSS